jgi:hypothetical protein
MTVTRVRYRERQRLAAEDLQAEQRYRLAAMGRHLLGPHQWGVVRGLWLVADAVRGPGNWLLAPGVAIDGYGRELLVTRPIEIAGAPGSVILYYCEAEVGIPPCGQCDDRPAPRIGQYVRLLVKQGFTPLAGDPTDLALARAAGTVPDHPPWPVLLADIDPLKPDEIYRRTRYVRHRADQIWSPARQVFLRLGATAASDFYPFLLWTRPPTPAGDPVKRLGVDRDGTIHVWQPLWISGDQGSATVQGAGGTALHITTAMRAGIGVRVFIQGVLRDPTKPVLQVTLADSLGSRVTGARALTNHSKLGLDHAIELRGRHPVSFRLVKPDAPQKAVSPVMTRQREKQLKVVAFDEEMERRGGTLTMVDFDLPPAVVMARGCDDEEDGVPAGHRGPVLRFREGTGHVPGADMREIYAESLAGEAPATELRFAAGALDESDSHLRLAFGVRAEDKTATSPKMVWRPLLALDGAGKVVMPAQSLPFKDNTRLDVKGALHLPAIKNDPTDPLVQDLLSLAYIAGLRRVGRLAVGTVTVNPVPAPAPGKAPSVRRSETLVYNLTFNQATTVKRCLELVVGVGANGHHDVILRTIPEITGAYGQNAISSNVTLPAFWHLSDKVKLIHELVTSDAADKEYALQSTAVTYEVGDPPS